jgi:hypothetical protein
METQYRSQELKLSGPVKKAHTLPLDLSFGAFFVLYVFAITIR